MATNEELASLYVSVKVKADQLEAELNRLKATTENATRQMGNSFKGLGGELLKMGVIASGVRAAFKFIGEGLKEARDARVAFAQVSAAIKQTGGSAGYTADQLKRMADNMEASFGIDADTIMRDVSLQLLTFGNVTGEVFAKAQQSALDLSAVLGTDLKSQTIQLGKALENPIQGINALSRAGVTFTEVQKKNIAELVRQNDLLGAQTIILDEINAKYGEQAAAIQEADRANRDLDVAWSNLKETIGEALTPLLNDFLPKITDGIKGWITLIRGADAEFKKIKGQVNDNVKIALEVEYKDLTQNQLNENKRIAEETKAELESQIPILRQQIREEQSRTRLSDETLDKLKRQLNIEEDRLQFQKTSLDVIANIEKKRADALDRVNEKWTAQGKTVAEIRGKIEQLNDAILSAETLYGPNDPKLIAIRKEKAALEDLIKDKTSNDAKEVKSYKEKAETIKKLQRELTLSLKTEYEAALQSAKNSYEDDVAEFKKNTNDKEAIQKYEKDRATVLAKDILKIELENNKKIVAVKKEAIDSLKNIDRQRLINAGATQEELFRLEVETTKQKYDLERQALNEIKSLYDNTEFETPEFKALQEELKKLDKAEAIEINFKYQSQLGELTQQEKDITERFYSSLNKTDQRYFSYKTKLYQDDYNEFVRNLEFQNKAYEESLRSQNALNELLNSERTSDTDPIRRVLTEQEINDAVLKNKQDNDALLIQAEELKNRQMLEANAEYLEALKENWLATHQEVVEMFTAMTDSFEVGLNAGIDMLREVEGGWNDWFEEMKQEAKETNNTLQMIWVSMAESFINAVQKMVTEWIAAQTLMALFNIASGGLFSASSNAIKAIPAHTGGTFQDGRKIASFARGGSFIVPPGYPNDSFPMLVESGERVSVTPKSAKNSTDILLSKLISRVDALNMNLINRGERPIIIQTDIDSLEFVKNEVKPSENRLRKRGVKVDEL